MAIGTPEELERLVRGRRAVFQLREVSDTILNSLAKLQLRNLTRDGNRLTIDVEDPEEDNPRVVDAIVAAGGSVVTVSVVGSTLEDAYLQLVKEKSS